MGSFKPIRKSRYGKQKAEYCYLIGDNNVGSSYYKYMTLENAEKCISGSSLYFQEPEQWQDNYESYFYTANYKYINKEADCPPSKTYASCCTYKRNSEAAWKAYLPIRPKSLKQSYCVRFEFNKVRLRKLIDEAIKSKHGGQYKFYEGKIEYKDNGFFSRVVNKHSPKDGTLVPEHVEYFPSSFGLSQYLRLLLLKRNGFDYEREVRLFLVPQAPQIDTAIAFVIPELLSAVDSITINGIMTDKQQEDFKGVILAADPAFDTNKKLIFNYNIYTEGFDYRKQVKIYDNIYP